MWQTEWVKNGFPWFGEMIQFRNVNWKKELDVLKVKNLCKYLQFEVFSFLRIYPCKYQEIPK